MNFFDLLRLFGGLAFFLFGMNVMSGSLEKMAGGKLEGLLRKATSNPLISVLLGTAITIAMQSSSATTVMLVGLVNSGLMQFAQTLSVIFGANIGTTLTAWILSLSGLESDNFFLNMLKPVNFSPIFALIGAGLILFSKKEKKKSIGTVGIGFALLMYGMTMMSDAMKPLTQKGGFENFIEVFKNPILGLLLALVFTAVIQSSAASIGILQALSMTGRMSCGMLIPMIMGLNIGTCMTSVISCIGANNNAKRVAGVHVTIKVISTLIFLPLYLLLDWIFNFTFADASATPWMIAVIHTAFNILATLLLMPFSGLLVKLVTKILPEKQTGTEKEVFFLDERLLRSPSVAIAECGNKTVFMGTLAKDVLLLSMRNLYSYNEKTAETILAQEDTLDMLEDKLGTYLVPLGSQSLSAQNSRNISKMLHTIGDFERLGDHAVNLLKVSKEIYEKKISFSAPAQEELRILSRATEEILLLTEQAFREGDTVLADKVEPLEQVIDGLISQIKSNHITRLCAGNCTIELGFVLSDILTNYERISDHCSNVAVAIIELDKDSFDTHRYLNSIKHGDSESFNQTFEQYRQKYAVADQA